MLDYRICEGGSIVALPSHASDRDSPRRQLCSAMRGEICDADLLQVLQHMQAPAARIENGIVESAWAL